MRAILNFVDVSKAVVVIAVVVGTPEAQAVAGEALAARRRQDSEGY